MRRVLLLACAGALPGGCERATPKASTTSAPGPAAWACYGPEERAEHSLLGFRPAFSEFGARWEGGEVTYSFAPDGTVTKVREDQPEIAAVKSNRIYATMDAAFAHDTKRWKSAIRRAMARWSAVANVRFTECADDGRPFGTPGAPGTRGDIRYFCWSTGDGAMGRYGWTTVPPEGGDIRFDQDESWNDALLEIVAVHEVGHAIGLGHSCPRDGSKAMESDAPRRASLGDDDIRGAQALYGDQFEPNDSPDMASEGSSLRDAPAPSIGGPAGNSDLDWYRLRLARPTVTITLKPYGNAYAIAPEGLQSACGASTTIDTCALLNLAIAAFGGDGAGLGSADANPAGCDEVLSNLAVPPDGTVLIRVSGSGGRAPQRYELQVQ